MQLNKTIDIPMFPLSLVVLPGETESLHIFETRYKKLVNDTFNDNKFFGIPFIHIDELHPYGTTVRIKEITNTYPDGTMDILVEGLKVIHIEMLHENENQNQYDTATVKILPSCQPRDIIPLIEAFNSYKESLHEEIQSTFTDQEQPGIFEIARHLSLTELEKFELIKLEKSTKRMRYLINKIRLLIEINKRSDQLNNEFYLN